MLALSGININNTHPIGSHHWNSSLYFSQTPTLPMDSFSMCGTNYRSMPFNVAFNQTSILETSRPMRPVTYGPLTDLGTQKPATGSSGRINLILEGDSLTVGYGPKFQEMMNGEIVNVNNDAVSGEKITDMLTQIPELSRKYDPNAKENIMVLWAGTNDLSWNDKGDPIQAFRHLQSLAGAYANQGFKVMVLTLGYTRPLSQPQGNAFNALIKAAKGPWDAVLDLTAVPGLSGLLKNDMIHYTPQGYQKIADEVEKSLIILGWMG